LGGRADLLAQRSGFWLLVFCSLTLLDTEEICGRFGSFRRIECLYIALVGVRSDDLVSASLFEWFTDFLGDLCTSNR
ncbi:hypothetical protein, partial [Ruegeria arenilitoris]|uniref:hypothetical protein n=1 Tax=Ruegeria arenilitoris TaxID=1173585 RepID=UPI001C3DA30F